MTISDTELEAGLRSLRTRADEVAPPPADLARRTWEHYRAQRRSRVAMAVGGFVAALVFVGVPVVASTIAADPQGGQVAGPSGRTFVPSPPAGLYALPARGALADDKAWLDGVAGLDWELADPDAYGTGMAVPDAPLDTRRVVFADDTPDGRVALVLGLTDRHVVHAWFTGPEGAAPNEMVLAGLPGQATPDAALALVDAPGPESDTVTLVVVTEPGDSVDRGQTPVVDASGEATAERVTVDLRDGIGIHTADASWPWGYFGGDLRVRTDDGSDRPLALAESERIRGSGPRYTVGPDVAPADPRGLADRTDPEVSSWAVGSMLASYGLSAEEAQPTLLAAGPLGSGVQRYGELYGMTHPSGATSVWVVAYSPGTQNGASTTTFAHAPAGTALLDRIVAAQVATGILVSAPTGAQAQVLDASGTVLLTVPLERGAGTGPYNGQQSPKTVRVLAADGDVVAEGPVEGLDG